jgi:HAE1 family hydrophobic/amphiphilic exporter-1
MDKELMPKVDQGQFTIKVNMPAGTRLEVTNQMTEKVEKFLMTIPEIQSRSVIVGSTAESATRSIAERLTANQAEIIVGLKKKRKLKSSDVVQLIKNHFSAMKLKGVNIEYILSENVLAAGIATQAPITIELKGNSFDTLKKMAHEAEAELNKIEGIYDIKNNLSEPSPEVKVHIDKDKASLYGLQYPTLLRRP